MTNELGITAEEAGINLAMALGGCRHERVVDVETVTGEVVAVLCLDCDQKLPPGYGCTDCEYVETRTVSQAVPTRILSSPCRRHHR